MARFVVVQCGGAKFSVFLTLNSIRNLDFYAYSPNF